MSKSIDQFTDVWFDLYTGQQTIDNEGTPRIIILTKESFRVTSPVGYKRIPIETMTELIKQLNLAIKNSNNKLDFLSL